MENMKDVKADVEQILKAQALVRELAQLPSMKDYVIQHRMKDIDSRLALYDKMLDKGWITLHD